MTDDKLAGFMFYPWQEYGFWGGMFVAVIGILGMWIIHDIEQDPNRCDPSVTRMVPYLVMAAGGLVIWAVSTLGPYWVFQIAAYLKIEPISIVVTSVAAVGLGILQGLKSLAQTWVGEALTGA